MNHHRKEYKLEIRIGIQEYDVSYVDYNGTPISIDDVKIDDNGGLYAIGTDGNKWEVRRQEHWNNGGRLNVEETRTLGAKDFMGLMSVLGEMHKAIERIQ